MSDVIVDNLLSGLKELFANDQLSDKILHIVEIDEEVFDNFVKEEEVEENEKCYLLPSSSNGVFEDHKSDEEGNDKSDPDTRKHKFEQLEEEKEEHHTAKKKKMRTPNHKDDNFEVATANYDDVIKKKLTTGNLISSCDSENKTQINSKSFPVDINTGKNFIPDDINQILTDKTDNTGYINPIRQYQEPVDKSASLVHNMSSDSISLNQKSIDTIEVVPYSVMPVHSIILSLNSDYFKSLLTESGMREIYEKYITIKVNVGEGKYLKRLIHAFYDQTVLEGLGTLDLLRVLEIADRFSCDMYLMKCATLLKFAKIKSFQECNDMALNIRELEIKMEARIKMHNIGNDMKQSCVRFLVEHLCPLENRTDQHDNFQNLNFYSLLLLLRSGNAVTWNENSLLLFILSWLDFDENRQIPTNIKLLLSEINYKNLTPDFLYGEITLQHPILSLWKDFGNWFVDALAFHAFSHSRMKMPVPLHTMACRNHTDQSSVPGWIVKFESISNTSFTLQDDYLTVWNGYIIRPRLFARESSTEDLLELTIHITHSNLVEVQPNQKIAFNFTLAVAVLPIFEMYNNDLFTRKCAKFIRHHFRQVDVVLSSHTSYFSFDVGFVAKLHLEGSPGLQLAMAFKNDHERWPVFMRGILKADNDKCYLVESTSCWQWYFDKRSRYP